MYKILYNEKQIKLLNSNLVSHVPQSDKNNLIVHYTGNPKFLLNCMDKLEKNKELKNLWIFFPNIQQLKVDFFSLFRIIRAAGGLVVNQNGKVLMIHRRGFWDLPKGKIEEYEKKKEAAIREVIEETGIRDVNVIQKLKTTYHIYRTQNSNRRILKPSYWYLMHDLGGKLKPQKEEDIEQVAWKRINAKTLGNLKPIYNNIRDVLTEYISIVTK